MPESSSQTGSSGLLSGVAGDQCYSGEPEKTMKVEVLYFSGCPNHPVAVDRVREILQQENVTAEMIEIQVRDAATADAMKFLGSPTIRIDGHDIELAARSAKAFGLTCRTYMVDGHRDGVPPMEWIRAALIEAKQSNRGLR
jgi:hypothetical protein